ncbi:hypothetical protein GWI33_005269 [Rhynchophorus ferrugineus]|uniref:DNA-directed RNA polymerase III subunit RPC3 n=1 Tax=Rhynchophorus ferrugineus TaxID=354439 RepID=A0A834IKT4_RHYFE|nr:hypothetical protein GWI33_005269 [Rhynchophorus ferrugineus]
MSITYGKVVSLIISERFGPVVEKVANFLFKCQNSPLLFIKKGTDLPISKIRESLCVLIKYRLVRFKANKNENLANYTLDSDNVLLMLRYPKYLNHAKKSFGDESEMIIEEVLQRGYWTASELILKVYERLSTKYLTRLPYPKQDKAVPILTVDESEQNHLPNIDIKVLVMHQKGGKTDLPDKKVYWVVNFDRFHQDMRDHVICTAFSKKFDDNAGDIIRIFLRQMYIRTDPWTDISNPIPALEVKDILKKQAPSSHSLAFFDQYMSIIEQDNSKLLRKAGEASGGSYQIYLKDAFTQFVWELIEQIVLEKYDSKAARIFRLVKLKPYIEPDQLQQLAMIPAKDAKMLSYQLYEDNYLHIQELRKASTNSGPTKNFTLFHIKLNSVVRMLLETCYKTLLNTMIRRNNEKLLNKRIIDKKHRIDTILMAMRDQNATEEQMADIEEMITLSEKEILEKVNKVMKNLGTVELEVDDTIFMLQMFLVYQ